MFMVQTTKKCLWYTLGSLSWNIKILKIIFQHCLACESTFYSCLNVKEFPAWSRCEIWSLSDCTWTQTHNHLFHKRSPICLNCWVFVYELSGCRFESTCSRLTFETLRLFSFRTEESRRAFEEEENEILQRDNEENSNNIVQNQEQVAVVAVSSTASVVKPLTSLCSSNKNRKLTKISSSSSREWTQNEYIEWIARWVEGFLFVCFIWISWKQIKCNEIWIKPCFMK